MELFFGRRVAQRGSWCLSRVRIMSVMDPAVPFILMLTIWISYLLYFFWRLRMGAPNLKGQGMPWMPVCSVRHCRGQRVMNPKLMKLLFRPQTAGGLNISAEVSHENNWFFWTIDRLQVEKSSVLFCKTIVFNALIPNILLSRLSDERKRIFFAS